MAWEGSSRLVKAVKPVGSIGLPQPRGCSAGVSILQTTKRTFMDGTQDLCF